MKRKWLVSLLLGLSISACATPKPQPWQLADGYTPGHYYVKEINVTQADAAQVPDFENVASLLKAHIHEYLKSSKKTPPSVIICIELVKVKIKNASSPVMEGNITLVDADTHAVIGDRHAVYYTQASKSSAHVVGNPLSPTGLAIATPVNHLLDATMGMATNEDITIDHFAYEVLINLYPTK